MNTPKHKTYMLLALATAIGLLFHGSSFFSTLEDTYDIYVHIFFADHYAKSWFEPWENRWYTGFNMISYPPLSHQLIALLSYFTGLKFGAYLLAVCIILLYVTGAYRFSKLITVNERAAGYAALSAVFLPSVIEALHVFGQLPTVLGIGWLLHALPEIYLFIRHGKTRHFITGLSLVAVAVCSHHVTPIFGMVFFVLPLMGTAIMDSAKEKLGNYKDITLRDFFQQVKSHIARIVVFGLSTIVVTILVILPYWIWSKNDPISQVPIPHGSRDDFLEVASSGLVFFVIPWGFILFIMPFLFYRLLSKRNIFFGLSFCMLVVLGTGGTTPIPKMLLGETAFSILTLERFTFWATIMAIPLVGEFLWRMIEGNFYKHLVSKYSKLAHQLLMGVFIFVVFLSSGFTTNLGYFRPLQPETIDITPIVNFLQSDKHYKWRYLTLGFGDQMAWLSANTNALTIDGNYHSARRVPELTTRAIERLENAKYRGTEGIGTLQQFLTNPQKFHLKYIFSNDQFYDPALYFTGWQRVKRLSNNVMVWERADIPPLPSVLAKKEIPRYQKILWGIVPLITLFLAFFFNIQLHWINHIAKSKKRRFEYNNPEIEQKSSPPLLRHSMKIWTGIMVIAISIILANIYWDNETQSSCTKVVESYYDALDFKEFERAYSYLNPSEGKSLDQFLLESSLTNGIVDSYGKLDRISTKVLETSSDQATIEVTLDWVTPIENYTKTFIHTAQKIESEWYMNPLPFLNEIPTNQFFKHSSTAYFNQGRRRITTKETFHEDVLDRPVVEVKMANLVLQQNQYSAVGQIQNLDDYPADITIRAILYDKKGQYLGESYDQYYLKHKLLPKEVTPFRLDFNGIEFSQASDTSADSIIYNPKDSMRFSLEVLASVASQDLYTATIAQNINIHGDEVVGNIFNYGQNEVTICQVLTSYFDVHQDAIWVDHEIIEKSIAPSKSRPFQIAKPKIDGLAVINRQPDQILVNGIDNDLLSSRYSTEFNTPVIPGTSTDWNLIHSVKLTLNNYLGNPSPF